MAFVELDPATDDMILTIHGQAVDFPADRLTIRRQESTTRAGGPVHRYLSITVALRDEFPETIGHVTT